MEQFIYAQMDTETNICIGVSYLSGEVQKSDMSRINQETALHCLGRRYVNGEWKEVPFEPIPEEEPQPSNSELLQKLQEQETTNLNRDEMMLEQQLMLLDIQLNVGA